MSVELHPSASSRWLSCPASASFQEEAGTSNPAAEEGTHAHEVLEKLLKGKEPPEHTKEMRRAVDVAYGYIQERVQELEEWSGEAGFLVEEKLKVTEHIEGTADCVLISPDELEVVDYKHGIGVSVWPEENTQLMLYGWGAIQKIGITKPDFPVLLTIIQPRDRMGHHYPRVWETTVDEIKTFIDTKVSPQSKQAQSGEPCYTPSDDNCRWCPGLKEVKCPAILLEFKSIRVLANLGYTDKLEPEHAARVFLAKGRIYALLKALEARIYTEMHGGSKKYAENLKLVRKQTRRRFVEKATEVLDDYLDREAYTDSKMRGLDDIERALKEAVGPKEMKEIMKAVTWKPKGELTVVPVDDRRDAVKSSAKHDFADLKEDQ